MKKKFLPKKIRELASGQIDGGFLVLKATAVIIAGMVDPTDNCQSGTHCINNCNGGNCGNCVQGCGGSTSM